MTERPPFQPQPWVPDEDQRMGDLDDFRITSGWSMVDRLNGMTGRRRMVLKAIFVAPFALMLLLVLIGLLT